VIYIGKATSLRHRVRSYFGSARSLEPKVRALANAPFLEKLAVTGATGEARPGMADKLRQVERFVELLGHLVDGSELRDARAVRVCDMGAGKGYLTFAAHAFFRNRGIEAEVIGVEQRPELVEQTNRIARELDCAGLRFERGAIADFTLPERLDVLIALHACDTATDDALAAGVRAGAKLLVVAPCCHKEVRRRLSPPPVLSGVLRHGILAERQAELLTDGLRALALEAAGYDAKVFEFIASEHTAKNLMLAATKRPVAGDPSAAKAELRALMDFFGLPAQRLVTLLSAGAGC
ncbi:MAG: methyltransferase, partial [Chthoniobacteraceae bacterium]